MSSFESYRSRIEELLDAGIGVMEISRILKVPKSTVHDWIKRIRLESFDSPRAEKVKEMLDSGADNTQVARALKSSIGVANSWINKVTGGDLPVDKTLREVLSKGTTLSLLTQKFGIDSIEVVRERALDLFRTRE